MDKKNVAMLLKGVTAVLTVIVIIFAVLLGGLRLVGFQLYAVLSGSMEPDYPTGSLIYVRAVEPEELEIRDVITYRLAGSAVATHRIVDIVSDSDVSGAVCFITKGDANDQPDNSPVSSDRIIGRVSFCIPGLGYVANYIQTPAGICFAVAAAAAVLLLMTVTDQLEEKNSNKNRKK